MKRDDSRPIAEGERDPNRVKSGKKPYEAPAWEVEETFGATVSCAKADDTACAAGPITS